MVSKIIRELQGKLNMSTNNSVNVSKMSETGSEFDGARQY